MCLVQLKCRGVRKCKGNPQFGSGIRKLLAGSANCQRNPQIVSGIRINLRNRLTFAEHVCFAEPGTPIHNGSLRNPQPN